MSEYVNIESWKTNPHRVVTILPGGKHPASLVVVGNDGVLMEVPISSGLVVTECPPPIGADKQYTRTSPMSAYWALRAMAAQGKPSSEDEVMPTGVSSRGP